MEIKQKGISPSTWHSEVTCPYCKAVLKIFVNDISIRTKPRRNFWGTKKLVTFFIVECGECKHPIKLERESLPEPIVDYLYDHRKAKHFIEDFFECYFS